MAFGSRAINSIVQVLNVDGIVQSIDLNELIAKLDLNEILERIDLDQAIDRIDLERAIDRIDVNRLVGRLNVQDLVERAELGGMVARSTTGLVESLLNGNRAQLVVIDQFVQGVGWIRARGIPRSPRLGSLEAQPPPLPSGARNIAVAVQGRYAGTVSRIVAFLLDQVIISMLFTYFVKMIQRSIEIVAWKEKGGIDLDKDYHWTLLVMFAVWQFLYFVSALAAANRTIGKAVVGLKVVDNEHGDSVTWTEAALRTLCLPLTIWSIVGVLCGLVRSDRRELHDLLAGTAVVYSWDARLARYRQEVEEEADELYTGHESFMTEDVPKPTSQRRYRLFSKTRKSFEITSLRPTEVTPLSQRAFSDDRYSEVL